MKTYIQGNKFKELARFIYAPPHGKVNGNKYRDDINNIKPTDYRYLVSTIDKRQLTKNDIIYTHTFYADQLFEYLEAIKFKLKVITHNSDTSTDFLPPENITWFSTNVNIDHPGIKSIPIGLENDNWYPEKRDKMKRKLSSPKVFKNLLYLNHNVKTNPVKRQPPYDVLAGRPWVTVGTGSNGQGFDNYLDNIYNHPYVVCPEGNGIDTHRVWECLYVNTIPIMIKNINTRLYDDLPVLIIDEWDELTERFLHDKYMEMAERQYNREKLWMEWWKNEIINSNSIL